MNPKSYEVVPGTGIYVIDQSDIVRSDTCTKYIEQEPRFRRGPTDPNKMPEQLLRYKIGRNFGWSIIKSYLDKDNMRYMFNCMVNADSAEDRPVTKEEICKSMHWTNFELCDNDMNVKFTVDRSWYDPLPAKPKVAKKRGRKAKAK